jgi:hypothetical protein
VLYVGNVFISRSQQKNLENLVPFDAGVALG